MGISEEIKEKLLSKGASIVGYADLSTIPEENRRGFNYGIIIGVALKPNIVQLIKDGPIQEYYDEAERIDKLLNNLDEYIYKILKDYGYDSLAKTQSVVKVDKNKRSELPHKTIATRAGIGWIGKCALLVTKEFGSAIRLSSVLTNAELSVGTPIEESYCGNCMQCKKNCPSYAIVGENWRLGLDRDEFFKPNDCKDKILERGKVKGWDKFTCGICIASCPWTQKYVNREKQ